MPNQESSRNQNLEAIKQGSMTEKATDEDIEKILALFDEEESAEQTPDNQEMDKLFDEQAESSEKEEERDYPVMPQQEADKFISAVESPKEALAEQKERKVTADDVCNAWGTLNNRQKIFALRSVAEFGRLEKTVENEKNKKELNPERIKTLQIIKGIARLIRAGDERIDPILEDASHQLERSWHTMNTLDQNKEQEPFEKRKTESIKLKIERKRIRELLKAYRQKFAEEKKYAA